MKKWIWIVSIAILTVIAATSAYAYNHYKKTAQKISVDFEQERPPLTPITEPFNALLLGIGDRPGDPGRADSVIFVSVNPQTESIFTFNLPRDMYVPMAGKDFSDKLNHSFAYGRTEMTLHTVEQYLETPIDYVVQINMNGLRQVVDAFGGIEVNNPFAFEQRDEIGTTRYTYDKGPLHLDGERALHYARMRKMDPKGDLGRNERQREVIQAILEKADTPKTLFKIPELLEIVGDNLKTNISVKQMTSMFQNYQDKWQHYDMETYEVVGDGELRNRIYYYVVSEEEKEHLQSMIDAHANGLPLPKKEEERQQRDQNLEQQNYLEQLWETEEHIDTTKNEK